MTLHPSVERAFEEIDAALFSGDSFDDVDNRQRLREIAERWLREIGEPSSRPLTAAMDSLHAWRIGEAVVVAKETHVGDLIDRGLVVLRELNARGFDIHLKAVANG